MERNYYSRYELSPPQHSEKPAKLAGGQGGIAKVFKITAIDDLILIAVIFILMTDEKPDIITILALLYIFIV